MDRRRSPRRRVRIRVRLNPGRVLSVTGDASATGLFVRSARVHRPGTRVRVEVETPEGPAEALGVVRWAKRVPAYLMPHARGGMGIEFTWMSPEFEAFLADSLEPVRAVG